MSIIQQIKAKQLEARKARENETAACLTTLIGEAEAVGKKSNREVTDDEVFAVIKKFIKGMDETMQILGDTHPQLEFVKHEKSVLEAFLPKQLSNDELAAEVNAIHAGLLSAGEKVDVGSIMKVLKTRFGANYDGKAASTLIKAALA